MVERQFPEEEVVGEDPIQRMVEVGEEVEVHYLRWEVVEEAEGEEDCWELIDLVWVEEVL